MERVLEPEVMDCLEEAIEYDEMDFTEVNTAFAEEAIALAPLENALVLDAGTGTGRIPILMGQMRSQWQIIAIDLAKSMLEIASHHIEQARLQSQIHLELVDAKHLPYADGQFDLVMSNSLIHHLPDPLSFFSEIKRVLKPNGGIFLRDLFRPADEARMNALVDSVGREYNENQKKLFRDSLKAALTLDEVKQLISLVDLQGVEVYQSSDRHWTAKRNWNCDN
ncbi:class I SAM-dependent methyltransferase [Chlorogloeopsis sp. ULAP01]|uniref:class I SAM-dependent methyltransferase n=1 Tax=Chlorogloeopsis sp. ULAP01 TaxID=3056483 RepID=UPI0025AB4CE1|nr:class I SAM-dependent methyltransferase [Chlorogloeopsis sp. ULAP01]MDM9380056.1 class I SAM-dependent methyltransferase [Chlorogloeopsis sp. ULAP01]